MELRNHNFTSDISAISHHFDAPNIQPQSITKIIEEDILRESLDSPFKSTYSEEKNDCETHASKDNNNSQVKRMRILNKRHIEDKSLNIRSFSPTLPRALKAEYQSNLEERHLVEVPAVMEVDVKNRLNFIESEETKGAKKKRLIYIGGQLLNESEYNPLATRIEDKYNASNENPKRIGDDPNIERIVKIEDPKKYEKLKKLHK